MLPCRYFLWQSPGQIIKVGELHNQGRPRPSTCSLNHQVAKLLERVRPSIWPGLKINGRSGEGFEVDQLSAYANPEPSPPATVCTTQPPLVYSCNLLLGCPNATGCVLPVLQIHQDPEEHAKCPSCCHWRSSCIIKSFFSVFFIQQKTTNTNTEH